MTDQEFLNYWWNRARKAEAKLAGISRYIESRHEWGETVSGYDIEEIIEEIS